MKKITLFFAVILLIVFVSCTKEKEYTYVQYKQLINIETGEALTEEYESTDTMIMSFESDSAAYCFAYEDFCTMLMAEKIVSPVAGGMAVLPNGFELINEEGEDIANKVDFEGKEEFEKKTYEESAGSVDFSY